MEEFQEVTKQTEDLISVYKKDFLSEEEKHAPKIQVSRLVSKVAFLYEKVRNTIDYKEEHLLRKNAIKRILRRRLALGSNAKKIAQPLVYELIQARYLENNAVPEGKIIEVEQVIDKYIVVMNQIFAAEKWEKKEKAEFINWLLAICACEIEDIFAPHFKEEALVRFMYQMMTKGILWQEEVAPEEERDIQIYIAIHRSLLKSDREIISYQLFNLYYPNWRQDDERMTSAVVENIKFLYQTIEAQIDHKLSFQLLRVIKKYIAPFVVLEKVILSNPKEEIEEIVSSSKLLEEKIQDACNEEYKKRQVKLKRSSIRAIIYIFLTKMLFALILEVPYDLYFGEEIRRLPLALNILFPPFLLFLIALSLRVPKEENTNRIIKHLKKIIYEGDEEVFYRIKPLTKRHIFFSVLFNIAYLIIFGVSFGLIIWALSYFRFNAASTTIFLLFLSLVSFFGIRNREQARELIVLEEKEGIRTTILDFFSIPILRVGRWISLNFSKINIFVFVFDFIIEAPFKAFVEIIDDFLAFIKEKKEEITIR